MFFSSTYQKFLELNCSLQPPCITPQLQDPTTKTAYRIPKKEIIVHEPFQNIGVSCWRKYSGWQPNKQIDFQIPALPKHCKYSTLWADVIQQSKNFSFKGFNSREFTVSTSNAQTIFNKENRRAKQSFERGRGRGSRGRSSRNPYRRNDYSRDFRAPRVRDVASENRRDREARRTNSRSSRHSRRRSRSPKPSKHRKSSRRNDRSPSNNRKDVSSSSEEESDHSTKSGSSWSTLLEKKAFTSKDFHIDKRGSQNSDSDPTEEPPLLTTGWEAVTHDPITGKETRSKDITPKKRSERQTRDNHQEPTSPKPLPHDQVICDLSMTFSLCLFYFFLFGFCLPFLWAFFSWLFFWTS